MCFTWNTRTPYPVVIKSVYPTRNIVFQLTFAVAGHEDIIELGPPSTICKLQLGAVPGHVFICKSIVHVIPD